MKLLTIPLALMAFMPVAYSLELQLADYEEVDPAVNLTTPDPSASINVVSGGGAMPIPSSGAKMLQLSWNNETDRKVEVRHDWAGLLEFDLDGNDRLLVDLYIPAEVVSTTEGASTLLGLWDPVIGWRSTLDAIVTDQWVTYGFDISSNTALGLDVIHALILENLGADAGAIYIDNIRVSSALIREHALHVDGPLTTIDSDLRLTDYDGSGNSTDLYVEGIIDAAGITVGGQPVVLNTSTSSGGVSIGENAVGHYNGIALGQNSFNNYGGISIGSSAWGQMATVIGSSAYGTYQSVAIGRGSRAEISGTAIGDYAKANNTGSTALGKGAQAFGQNATALGYGAQANAFHSLAFGYNIGAYDVEAAGDTTWIDTDPLFELGNGRDEANRSNALTILKNGQATLTNTYWNSDVPGAVPSDPNASAGEALRVEGHTHLAGNAQVAGNIDAASLSVAGNISAAAPSAANHVATKAYVDANDVWSANGNEIYTTDGFVGIGTDNPDSPLHIKGGYSPWGASMELDGSNEDGDGGRRWQLISTSTSSVEGPGVFMIKDFTENHLSGGSRHFAIYPDGSVAIGPQGNTAPTSKLQVNGNIIAAAPTAANHVATKAYVDEMLSEVDPVFQASPLAAITQTDIDRWNAGGTLSGQDGSTWLTGEYGLIAGTVANNDGDLFLDSASGKFYVNVDGAWPAIESFSGNLKGANGATGPAGPAGSDGANGLNGTDGQDGADGAKWYTGTYANIANDAFGSVEGDLFLDKVTGNYYIRGVIDWPAADAFAGNLKGPSGNADEDYLTDADLAANITSIGVGTASPDPGVALHVVGDTKLEGNTVLAGVVSLSQALGDIPSISYPE